MFYGKIWHLAKFPQQINLYVQLQGPIYKYWISSEMWIFYYFFVILAEAIF